MLSKSCRIKCGFNSFNLEIFRHLAEWHCRTHACFVGPLFQKVLVITLRWVFEKLHKAAGGTSMVNRSLEKQRAAW